MLSTADADERAARRAARRLGGVARQLARARLHDGDGRAVPLPGHRARRRDRRPTGRVGGFLQLVPSPASDGYSLASMRRRRDTPNGLMEYLITETVAWARQHAVTELSLNFAVFADFLRTDETATRWTRAMRWGLLKADRLFQVERLHSFNRKFFPHWRRRYFCFERWSDLPLAGSRVPARRVAARRRPARGSSRPATWPRDEEALATRARRSRRSSSSPAPRRARSGAASRARSRTSRRPVYATSAPGEPGNLYVVEQAGRILVLDERQDPERRRSSTSARRCGAAASRGCCRSRSRRTTRQSHRFYVDYTDSNGDTRVVAVPLERHHARSRRRRSSCSSSRTSRRTTTAASSQFGPDGRLYWGNGDGGGGGDPQHNGQSLARPFAKIMRLNIERREAALAARRLRPAQPVALLLRPRDRRPLHRRRRPGRVGGDRLPAHGARAVANFGWNRYEGRHILRPVDEAADARRPTTRPIAEYPHSQGCSVTGGYVYRGSEGAGGGRAGTSTATTARERLEPEGLGRQGDAASGASRSRSRGSRRSARTRTASCTRCRSTPATSSASRADTPRRAVSQGLSPGHGAVGHVPGTVPRSCLS